MQRIIEPELLDELPASDPAAQHSRGDLRRLNAFMGHAGRLSRELRSAPSAKRICDLGGGDATLMLAVARKTGWRDVLLTIVDRQNTVSGQTEDAFAALGWRVAVAETDVHAFLAEPRHRFDAITANLFLHHFQDEALREMLARAAERAPLFVACEPRRSARSVFASRCVGLLGCNGVTRHDAVKSVHAGFTGRELSALWPSGPRWRLDEKSAGLFGHLFAARKT